MFEEISIKSFTPNQLSPSTTTNIPPFIWNIPGSKSITNRALLLAALSPSTTTLNGVLQSDDTKHMMNALRCFGVKITEVTPTTFEVSGGIENLKPHNEPIFIGNSGTTVRFLASFACLVPGDVTFVGDIHMAKRPIKDLVEGLKQLNVEIDCPTGCPPLTIKSSWLNGGEIKMSGSKSSQYFTSVMMAAPFAKNDVKITVLNELVSVPYVKMTQQMMKSFGADVSLLPSDDNIETILIKAKPYNFTNMSTHESHKDKFVYNIEADASAASYAFAAAAATGIKVSVPIKLSSECIKVSQSLQGDFAFLDILEKIGCDVKFDAFTSTVTVSKKKDTLTAIEVDMFHISDTVMTLAAISPLLASSSNPTYIKNIANIRIKETDRLMALVNELKKLGQEVEYGDDWIKIYPKEVLPAKIECYSDHRIAMSFAILGLVREGITLLDKNCVNKTYPDFWADVDSFREHVLKYCSADNHA